MGRVTDIIRAWPTAAELASDLGMTGRKGTRLVRMWAYRGTIPPARFPAIVEAAQKRQYHSITLQSLHAANGSGAPQ